MKNMKEEIQKAINLLKENGYEVKKIILDKDDEYTFDNIWNLYDKKVGCKDKLRKKWNSMSKADRKAATEYVPLYVIATEDKKYRKNFQTFLNQRSWEDEIIGGTPPPVSTNESASEISQLIAKTKVEQEQNTEDAKRHALRQRIYGMIQVLHNNPHSLCRKQLEIYHDNGTLERLGIQWNP